MKKWLLKYSEKTSKELIDSKMNSDIDIEKLLECMNVKNTIEGIKKLYKILGLILNENS